MGLTNLKIEIANPANPDVTEAVEFLIDSGAVYSVIPSPVLERLGVRPSDEEVFRLANGQTMRRRVGTALFKYQHRARGATVVFGEEGDSVLLGAHTLEALGFALNPIRRELIPLEMVLG